MATLDDSDALSLFELVFRFDFFRLPLEPLSLLYILRKTLFRLPLEPFPPFLRDLEDLDFLELLWASIFESAFSWRGLDFFEAGLPSEGSPVPSRDLSPRFFAARSFFLPDLAAFETDESFDFVRLDDFVRFFPSSLVLACFFVLAHLLNLVFFGAHRVAFAPE